MDPSSRAGIGPTGSAGAFRSCARPWHDCDRSSTSCGGLVPQSRPGLPDQGLSLSARQVEAVRGPCAQTVPSAAEVMQALEAVRFDGCMELGVALDLPARFLLSLDRRSDPLWLLKNVLQKACPLSLENLGRQLDGNYLNAPDMACQVREMARHENKDVLLRNDSDALEQLTELLAPLCERAHGLATMLRLDYGEILALEAESRCHVPGEQLWSIVERACRMQQRTCAQWMAALAQSDAGDNQLDALAQRWQLQRPAGSASWLSHLGMRPESVSRQLLLWHQHNPGIPVPLSLVWLLARWGAHRPAFFLAMDDAISSPHQGMLALQRLFALFALLHCAGAQQPEGVSWSVLERLGRFGCLSARQFLQQVAPVEVAVQEPGSRRLRPSDLLRLVKGVKAEDLEAEQREWESMVEKGWVAREREAAGRESERQALEVAALLGVGIHYRSLQLYVHSVQDRALAIWKTIYTSKPGLETGHLIQLFRQFGKSELAAMLTGDPDSNLVASCSLDSLSPRSGKFVRLAQELVCNPGWGDAFVTREGLAEDSSYCEPEGADPVCQLLDCLACNSGTLTRFEQFVEERRRLLPEGQQQAPGDPDAVS
ncbi:MAG: hypothetical protein OXC07_08435 [Kistimonas sp.]|nr:hypothetical protein [Kistimonas sp.]